MSKAIVTGIVRLARNFADLPFPSRNGDGTDICVNRLSTVLDKEPFSLLYMAGIPDADADRLIEDGLLTPEMRKNRESGAVFVRSDSKLSLLVNEEDHIRILAVSREANLKEALREVFLVEKAIGAKYCFGFDEEIGYLTASPTNAGTGMKASVMLHLPCLTREKKMGEIAQSVSRLGLSIRGVFGDGNEAQGNLYLLSNQQMFGRSEAEMIDTVAAAASQLGELEESTAESVLMSHPIATRDRVFRSAALMRSAYLMEFPEFLSCWSNYRLGITLGLLNDELPDADELLFSAQDGHLAANDDASPAEARAQMLRSLFNK